MTLFLMFVTLLTSPPVQSTSDCTWDEMTTVLFSQSAAICEYHAALGVRVVNDTQVFVATECHRADRRGLCMLDITTNADAVIPDWNWRVPAGMIRVQPGGLFVDHPASTFPSIAFGRSVDDLAAKYPDAYRIGIKRLHSMFDPNITLADFVEARPSTACRHDAGTYACYESRHARFFLR
jgi:hypothetical protein